jgi:hypothetical protein
VRKLCERLAILALPEAPAGSFLDRHLAGQAFVAVQRRRGMLIWGWRTSVARLALVLYVCQRLNQPAAHQVLRRVTKFTLFFIPLFPISSKYVIQCTLCGEQRELTKEQAHEVLRTANAAVLAPATPPGPQALPHPGPAQPQLPPPGTAH